MELDLSELINMRDYLDAVITGLDPEDWPHYTNAISAVSEEAEVLYKGYLKGLPIPGKGALKRPSGPLSRAVYRRADAWLTWSVGNASPIAGFIENGTGEYDMKQNLLTAPKARVSKKGVRYLIIPFRHGIPTTRGIAAMPKEVYALAQKLAWSKSLGAPSTRLSATGHTVPKFMYSWKGRVTAEALKQKQFEEQVQPHWKSSRYQGMVRMGKKGQSTYITFRVMSANSKGWVRPAQPAMAPLDTALKVAWSNGLPMIWEAASADFDGILTRT